MGITANTVRNWRRPGNVPADDPLKNKSFKEFARTQFAKSWMFLVEDRFVKDTGATIFALNGVFPFIQWEAFQHHDGNTVRNYPEMHMVQEFQITFYETDDLRVFNYFSDWAQSILNEDGTYALPSKYKRPYVVYQQNKNSENIHAFRYERVWPREISPWEPSYEDRNVIQFTVSFTADTVKRLKPVGVSDVLSELSTKVQANFRPDPNIAWSEARTAARLQTAKTRGQNLVGSALNIGTAATGASLQVPGIPL